MRYLILSDIHANLEGLEAVLSDAAGDYDRIVCCGDIVGYGADPNAATEWVRQNVPVVVRGNHDKAAAGSEDIEWFNPVARAATLWTQSALTPENLAYLTTLPQGPIVLDGFQLVHGSPLDEDDYIVGAGEASQLFGYLQTPVTFFGHSHLQGGFLLHRSGATRIETLELNETSRGLTLSDNTPSLINPGSVGQPRDGDPRAAYATYDPDEKLVTYHRVDYDLPKAQNKIVAAGLPQMLAYRLGLGS